MIWQSISAILAIIVIVLLIRQYQIKKDLKNIADDLHEKLREDTNTPITLASSDRSLCHLVSVLNAELHTLREEKLRLKSCSHELQTAVTNIAHDLRTPLTAIRGYLELLEREPLGEKAVQYRKILCERTETLQKLTEELFRYSVIDGTAETLQMEKVSLNAELEIALAAVYQPLTAKAITPTVCFPEEPVERNADRKALQRIFGNILNNAVKYSTGDLTVSLHSDGTILFCNTSASLSEIEVGRLFDRFYTVNNAKGSTGLGLSIAKLLTEKMGGCIYAYYRDGKFFIEVRFPPNGK